MGPIDLTGILMAMVLSPALLSLIQRTKAFFGGRKGPPILQPYHDLLKSFQKGTVYSNVSSPLLKAAPWGVAAAHLLVLPFVPFAGGAAPAAFSGDFLLAAFLFAMARFLMILGALDTGSSFEGMGASREAHFSALAEPVFFLSFCALARLSESASLSGMTAGLGTAAWKSSGPALCLVGVALFVLLLSENARVPVDDPNTHLELTMIHEVMILDAGGPDLALYQYASGLRLWIYAALWTALLMPWRLPGAPGWLLHAGEMALAAVAVGVVESSMARLRLVKVPTLLIGAGVLSVTALILAMR